MEEAEPRRIPLKELLSELRLVETPLEAIIPMGEQAFSVDSAGAITGLKFVLDERVRHEVVGDLVYAIFQTKTLRRLVLAYRLDPPLDIPETILRLENLSLMWLHGNIRSIPGPILVGRLPVKLTTAFNDENYLRCSD